MQPSRAGPVTAPTAGQRPACEISGKLWACLPGSAWISTGSPLDWPALASRAMHYSSGNYEAIARPRRPDGVKNKTAWFVGAGLTSMASAVFMIRDGQLPAL